MNLAHRRNDFNLGRSGCLIGDGNLTPLMNVKHRHIAYFHGHPLHGTFSLIASLMLAGLIVITVLVTTAR
jgi:hypothetical protein